MTPDCIISDATLAFIEREVAIDVASCGSELLPSTARAYGCSVAPDRRRITLYLKRSEAGQLLQDVLVHDRIAAVFCLPATESALQIKGRQVSLSLADEHGVRTVARHVARFVAGVIPLGHERLFAEAYMHITPADTVALSFVPEVVFEQTPGPGAGRALPERGAA